jgi:hypothetical protein
VASKKREKMLQAQRENPKNDLSLFRNTNLPSPSARKDHHLSRRNTLFTESGNMATDTFLEEEEGKRFSLVAPFGRVPQAVQPQHQMVLAHIKPLNKTHCLHSTQHPLQSLQSAPSGQAGRLMVVVERLKAARSSGQMFDHSVPK